MWTWSFELADVLTTLTIISTLGSMAYYLVIRPFLQRIEEDRSGSRLVSRKRRKKGVGRGIHGRTGYKDTIKCIS